MAKEIITYDTFAKLDIALGTILSVEYIEGADKLLLTGSVQVVAILFPCVTKYQSTSSNPPQSVKHKSPNAIRIGTVCFMRRERDSNPRRAFTLNGFQDRRLQPLSHPSKCILLYGFYPHRARSSDEDSTRKVVFFQLW